MLKKHDYVDIYYYILREHYESLSRSCLHNHLKGKNHDKEYHMLCTHNMVQPFSVNAGQQQSSSRARATTSISHQPMSRHSVNWQPGRTNMIIQVRLNSICGTWGTM